MRQKNQVMMFSDAELSLLSNTFAGDNEELLYLIRNVLLQFPITEEERKRLKAVMNKEVYAVVKKRILPDLDPNSPFSQLADLYQTLSTDLTKRDVDEMAPFFDAKQLEIDYLDQQFKKLKNLDKEVEEKIKLDDLAKLKGKTAFQNFVETTARNFLLGYVDMMLVHLKTMAGQKTETLEELKKRLQRDSSK